MGYNSLGPVQLREHYSTNSTSVNSITQTDPLEMTLASTKNLYQCNYLFYYHYSQPHPHNCNTSLLLEHRHGCSSGFKGGQASLGLKLHPDVSCAWMHKYLICQWLLLRLASYLPCRQIEDSHKNLNIRHNTWVAIWFIWVFTWIFSCVNHGLVWTQPRDKHYRILSLSFSLQKAPLLMIQSHQLGRVQLLLCHESRIDWSVYSNTWVLDYGSCTAEIIDLASCYVYDRG